MGTSKENLSKSSRAMEAAGALEIFCHSVEKYKLVYQYYIDDGDTSSFKDMVASEPYEDHGIVPNKWECVGHIQKCLGTRLRELRKRYKNTNAKLFWICYTAKYRAGVCNEKSSWGCSMALYRYDRRKSSRILP